MRYVGYNRFTWLLAAFAGLFLSQSAGASAVGALAGEVSVDPTGAANYRIPIEIPRGAAGMPSRRKTPPKSA